MNDWLKNFARLVAKEPGKYDLCEQDAQIMAGLAQDFAGLFDLVQPAQTRTPELITQKDAIRALALVMWILPCTGVQRLGR